MKNIVLYGLVVLALILGIVGLFVPVAAPPALQFGALSVPTEGGVDMVSKTYGGTFDDAVSVVGPTPNATADTVLLVNNLSVAMPFEIQDSGTAAFSVYDAGGVAIAAPTTIATGVPALLVNSTGLGKLLDVQDGGTSAFAVLNGPGVSIAVPTAGATALPALLVNNLGKAMHLDVQDGGVSVLSALNGGGVVVAAPTAIATAVPVFRVDSSGGLSNLFEVRDSATPVFYIEDGGDVTGDLLRYATAGQEIVCGTASFTATATVAHGLSTPSYVMCSVAGDADGATDLCTYTNSSAVVTIKGWTITAGTPVAGAAEADFAWCVIGTP